MATPLEQLLYGLDNFLPYSFLILFPFKKEYRYNLKRTVLVYFLFCSIELTLFMVNNYLDTCCDIHITAYVNFALMLERLIFAAVVLKTQAAKALFILLVVKNFADTCSVFAMCLENIFFPEATDILYSFSNTFCLIVVQTVLYYPMLFYIRHNFSQDVRDAISVKMWNFLWMIPFLFYIIWIYLFYFNTVSSFEMAINPKNSLFMIVLFSGELMIYYYLSQLVRQNIEVTELKYEINQLNTTQKYYEKMQEHIEEIRILKHDMRHHLRVFYELLNRKEYDQLEQALQKEIDAIPGVKIVYTKNISLNLLLVYYAEKCQNNQVNFQINLNIPDNILLSERDTTVLFGNLLENAYDAAISSTKKSISFNAGLFQNQLVFYIRNTFENEIKKDTSGQLLSTKHEGEGFGIRSAEIIIKRYNGIMSHNVDNNEYSVSIFIPYTDTNLN